MTHTAKFTIHKLLGDEVEKTPMMEKVGLDAAKEVAEEMSFHTKVIIISQDGDVYNSAGQKIDMDIDWLHGDPEAKTAPVKKVSKPKGEPKPKAEPKVKVLKPKAPAEPRPKRKTKSDPLDALNDNNKEAADRGLTGFKAKVTDTPDPEIRNPSKRAKKVETDETVHAGDFLMWVGSSSAPTVEAFVEASKKGVGKKLSKLPRDMKPKESKILLAHDEGETGDAVIFGYFVIDKITMLVESEDAEVPENFAKDDRVTRLVAKEGQEPGLYAIGKKLVVLEKPLDYNALIKASAKRFRSYMRVDGPGLLNSETYKAAPVKRSDVEVKLPEGYEKPKENQDWTPEERQSLWDHAHGREDKARAFREFCRATGRSPQGVSYQYYRMKSKLEATAKG